MDDLRIKSQKIQIENRIKHLMLQETGETKQESISNEVELPEPPEPDDESQNSEDCVINPAAIVEAHMDETSEPPDAVDKAMKIEIEEPDDTSLDYESPTTTSFDEETLEGFGNRKNGHVVIEEPKDSKEQQKNIVAVRKDLFGADTSSEAPSFVIKKSVLPQNGRIVIKINKKRLESMNVNTHRREATIQPKISQSKPTIVIKPPPLAPIQASIVSKPAVDEESELQASKQEGGEAPSTYNCNKCSFVTSDVIKMYDHNRTYHSFDYTCQHCPFSTSKVELLGKHMTMVHPQNMAQKNQNFKVSENYACSLCPFSVKSLDLLRSHHMAAHGMQDGMAPIVLNSAFGEDITPIEPKILKRLEYSCDLCPYATRDKSNLRKHLFTHGTKPLKCDFCSYKCVSPYQLRRHQKQKHAKHCDLKGRSQPYKLPALRRKNEDLDEFKITLETIKRELEKEIAT